MIKGLSSQCTVIQEIKVGLQSKELRAANKHSRREIWEGKIKGKQRQSHCITNGSGM